MFKRQRERARKQKQQLKEQRRVERAAEREKKIREGGGRDADLEGIVPGPQPGQVLDFHPEDTPGQPVRKFDELEQ